MKEDELPRERARLTGFERFVLRVSPAWATRRYFNRVRLEATARAYESVEISRLHKKRMDSRSPDQIGSVSSDKLRYQARYLDENHDIAKSVLNTLVSNVVGAGILTFPTVKDVEGNVIIDFNDNLMQLWRRWSKRPEVTREHNWAKVQQISARSWFRDGEMFSQKLLGTVPDLEHASEVPFSIELMEADLCPTNVFSDGSSSRVAAQVAEGNTVRQGVEKDSFGRPAAYYFWEAYPSELNSQFSAFLISSTNVSIPVTSEGLTRVPSERVVHLKLTDRIRQTRGISTFASVYQRLDDLKDYEESERVAARIGAAFALAITKSVDSGGSVSGDATWREMDLAPGIIADGLAPGEKIEQIKNERPNNQFDSWRVTQLRSVAGGSRAGFSSLAKTYEGSYSSQRQELMEQFVIYRMIREEFVGAFIDPIYRDFILMVITAGLVDVTGVDMQTIFDAEHVGAGAPYIEPQREVNADEKKVQSGFNARSQIILQRGGNPLETQALILAERTADDEAGVTFSSTTPSVVAGPSSEGESGTTDPNAEDADEDDVLEGSESNARYVIGRRYENGQTGEVFLYTEKGFIREVNTA